MRHLLLPLAIVMAFNGLGSSYSNAEDQNADDIELKSPIRRRAMEVTQSLWNLSAKAPTIATEALAHAALAKFFDTPTIPSSQLKSEFKTITRQLFFKSQDHENFVFSVFNNKYLYCLEPFRSSSLASCLERLNDAETVAFQDRLISLWKKLEKILAQQNQLERAAVVAELTKVLELHVSKQRHENRWDVVLLKNNSNRPQVEKSLRDAIEAFERIASEIGVTAVSRAVLISEAPILFDRHELLGIQFADQKTKMILPVLPTTLPLTPAVAELLLDPRPVLEYPIRIQLQANVRAPINPTFKAHLGMVLGRLEYKGQIIKIMSEFPSNSSELNQAITAQEITSPIAKLLDVGIRKAIKSVARAIKHADCAVLLTDKTSEPPTTDTQESEISVSKLSARHLPDATAPSPIYRPIQTVKDNNP